MAKPRHRRCGVCGRVTARYLRTQSAGAIRLRVFVADPIVGEVITDNGGTVRCRTHQEEK